MGRASSGAAIAAAAVCLGVLACAYVLHPFTPAVPQMGLDASWVFTMAEMADRGARWGVDLAFTFGPAMPLYLSFYSDAYLARTLPLLLGVALLFGWCAALLVWHASPSRRRALAGVAACGVALVAVKSSTDPFYLTLPFLVFLLASGGTPPAGGRRLAVLAGGFAMGLAAMVKMSFPLAALPLFVLADAVALARRRWPLLLAPFGFGVVAGDLLYGQRLADLPAYVAAQGEVVAGYAAGMAIVGPTWDLGAFLAVAALMIAATLWAARRNGGGVAYAVPAGFAVNLLFLFKAGFIRHDLHSLIAWRGLAIDLVVLAWGWLPPWSPRASRAVMTGVAAFAAFVYVPIVTVRQSGEKPRGAAFARLYGRWLTEGSIEEISAAFAFLRDREAFRESLDAQRAQAWAAIAEAYPLGPLPGTVDILPSEQSRVLAARLDYRPRPSFQEYSTYTAGLAAMNRTAIEGPRAPDWMLFGPESALGYMSIDGRFPNLAEGLLWPDLLGLYRPDHRIGSLLALRRRERPTPVRMGPPRARRVGFGTPVDTGGGAGGAVWAVVDARLNLLGRLASLLYRPPLPSLAVQLGGGEVRLFRFVPDLGRAGFFVSPLVLNASDYEILAAGRAAGSGRGVAAVWLEASRAARLFYEPEVRIELSDVEIPAAGDAAPVAAGPAWERLVRDVGVRIEDDRVMADAPSALALRAQGLAHLTLGFGVLDSAWRDDRTEGVCFTVHPADGTGKTLWHTCLDPLDREADRGPHTVSLDLPPGTTEVALTTSCLRACWASQGYWSAPSPEAEPAGASPP